MPEVRWPCPRCGAVTFEIVRGRGEFWLVCRGRDRHRLRQFFVLETPPVPPREPRSEHSVYAHPTPPDH